MLIHPSYATGNCPLLKSLRVGADGIHFDWTDDFWVYWLTNLTANWNFGHGFRFWFAVLWIGQRCACSFNYRQCEQKGSTSALSSVTVFYFRSIMSMWPGRPVAGCDKGSTSVQSIAMQVQYTIYKFHCALTLGAQISLEKFPPVWAILTNHFLLLCSFQLWWDTRFGPFRVLFPLSYLS